MTAMTTFIDRYLDRAGSPEAPVEEKRAPLADMAKKPSAPEKVEIPTQPEKPANPILGLDLEDPHYYSKLADIMAEKPMTQEEEERRKRGAAASQAVAGLGNAISALSNVFLSGKAPSQTIAPIPKADYDTLEKKAREQRKTYVDQIMNGASLDYTSYQKAKQAAAALDYKRDKDEKDRAVQIAIADGNLDYKKDKDEKDRAARKAIADGRNETTIRSASIRANKSGGGNKDKKPDLYYVYGKDGKETVYDISNDEDAAKLFGLLANKNNFYEFDPVMGDKPPKTAKEMRTYIDSHYASHGNKFRYLAIDDSEPVEESPLQRNPPRGQNGGSAKSKFSIHK